MARCGKSLATGRDRFRSSEGVVPRSERLPHVGDSRPGAGIPFTEAFLKDWETRGFWQPRVKSFHIVWERIPEFEALVKSLKPAVHSP